MSEDTGRRHLQSIDVDNNDSEAHSPRVVHNPLDLAEGGSESDEEMQNELQNLSIVEPFDKPTNHRSSYRVSNSNSSLSDAGENILTPTNAPSNSNYVSADEDTDVTIKGDGARPKTTHPNNANIVRSNNTNSTTQRVKSTNKKSDHSSDTQQNIDKVLLKKDRSSQRKTAKPKYVRTAPSVID